MWILGLIKNFFYFFNMQQDVPLQEFMDITPNERSNASTLRVLWLICPCV